MATTTNFGWETPDDTDLVKDGAAAIRTLGGAIDTSLVDLKGGTTGQVLSKASNTDMDFSWVTSAGDIEGVTAGTGLTGGGTSGTVTLNLDVANYGGGQKAAGKNRCINGDFGIWQRGTSFTLSTGTEIYAADRFTFVAAGSSTAGNVSREAFTAGTAPASGYESQYFARLTNFATATSFQIRQKIEDVRTFAGQTMTFSFWVKGDNALSTVTAEAAQYFGSGGSSPVSAGSSTFSITTGWVRQSFTFTVPSISGKTIGTGSYFEVSFYKSGGITGGQKIDTWGWQVEAGSTATPFQTATGTIQGELAACQRYYWRAGADTTYLYAGFGVGNAGSTTQAYPVIQNPVTMRITPTAIDYSNLGLSDGVTTTAVTSLTFAQINPTTLALSASVASGLTQYRPYRLCSNNSASGYLGISAEL